MPRRSAGLLLYRLTQDGEVELLLVHPGGPVWARRDLGAWSIPKGEPLQGEDPLDAALREFGEETGSVPPDRARVSSLGEAVQAGGKVVTAFAAEGNCDVAAIRSNLFEMEWPPRSGQRRTFPEVDRAAWFRPEEACRRILPGQIVLVRRLVASLAASGVSPSSG